MSAIDEMEDTQLAASCCPQCAAVNLPQRKFCAKCGIPLRQLCLDCGETCAAGENFCGVCGVNLSSSLAAHIEQFEAVFQEAQQFQSVSRFDDGIALLDPIAKIDHPRLAEYVARAARLIRQLTAQRDRRLIVAEEALQRAEQCLAAFDDDGAARILEDVPRPLRSDVMREMLEIITARREEIGSLDKELHEAVREKRLLDMPPKLERLLALKPNHVFARALAEKVRTRLVQGAERRLAEHRYDEALRLLRQIAPGLHTPRTEELSRRAAELAWLSWDLRNAPVVDDTLVAVAERLRRLSPDDGRAAKLCDELQRRTRLAKGGQDQQPLPWVRPPKKTPLGVPVEWLTGFRRITCADALDRSDLLRHPGRFAIACGLALTGIKQAELRINLLSAQQQGVLHRMTHLLRLQSGRSAWGIDLGGSGLKAVKLAWNEAKKQAVIEAATVIEHAKPLSHAGNKAEEDRLVAETLQTFLCGQEIKTEHVCVGLPGRMALWRRILLPPVDPAKASKLVEFEAQHQVPFPLEQLAWDFQFLDDAPLGLDGTAKPPGGESRRALLIAAKHADTQRLLGALQKLKIRVDVLQTDFVALHNFLAYEHFTAPDNSPSGEVNPVVAALDVGCDVTNVVVSSPQSLWFRSCGAAGGNFTRALVKELKLSIAQAEQLKRAPESAECVSDLYEALSPVFDDLLKEVQQSLAAYAKAEPERPIQRICGLGGGFSLHGLLRYLRCGR
jgi:type IV pilus assembly protein PilM